LAFLSNVLTNWHSEAAVNKSLLYALGWGKKQAFCLYELATLHQITAKWIIAEPLDHMAPKM